MKEITPYLTFNGNCREAMTYYQKCLGGELQLLPFSEGAGKFDFPKDAKDRVMHARLTRGEATLMASDTMPGHPFLQGNNFSVSVDCESAAEVDKLHAAISEGGEVTMPVGDTFWNAHFGMCVDRFGVAWMFNYDKPKS